MEKEYDGKFDDPIFPMRKEDKENVLFELGFIWGTLCALKNDETACAVDSCESIKNIIDKY